jgi:molecular chaperone GrpE
MMSPERDTAVGSPGSDTSDAPNSTGASESPDPDKKPTPDPESPSIEPSVPAGEPEAPVGPSRPHGDDLDEALPPEESPEEPDHEGNLAADLEELTAKAGKADQYLELAQRTKADFENYRKRAAREAAAAQERGVAKLAKELLPAVDNLDRALAAALAHGNGTDDELVSGIKLVHADVIAALARVGIEPFDPAGEPFDLQRHEAIAQQPVEGAQAGTIVEVYQRGYRLGDSVLRPARVVVAG